VVSDVRRFIADTAVCSALGRWRVSTARCLCVLVVEDDTDIREVVASALASEGFQVYQADSGARALELLREIPHPSLILADLMMPVMNGWDLIKALSQDDRLATLPVVIVSAVDEQAPEGFRRVKKPFDLDELLKIVSELCARRT
jgi:two-component system, chemotaxis family, chemotaxis protein CheY